MTEWNVHYVHKISPKATPEDSLGPIELSDTAFADRKTLGKALRAANVLQSGIRDFRVEGDKVIVFPRARASIWHALILQPADSYVPAGVGGWRPRAVRRCRCCNSPLAPGLKGPRCGSCRRAGCVSGAPCRLSSEGRG